MKSQKTIGAFLGYIYTALQSLISLIYIPLLLNTIGKSEYGIYQIAGSVIAYFAAMEAPLCASILKYYVEYKVKDDKVYMENVLAIGRRIFWILSAFFILLSIPVGFALNESFKDTFTETQIYETLCMFILMIVNLIINMNNYVYLAAINGHERFIFVKLSSLAILILQPILVLLVIQQYHYAFAIVAVQCVLNIIMAIIRKYYAIKKLNCKIRYHGFDRILFKHMMILTGTTLGVALADQIFWKSDQIILGSLLGPDIVAEYAIGSQFNTMYISVACVLGSIILPTVTKILVQGTNQDISHYFAKVGRYQSILVVFVLVGVIAFGHEFIYLLAGEGYITSYYVALLLMIPYSIDLIQICGNTILQAKNQYGYRAKMMIVSSIIKIALTMVLIKLIGPIGAALSTSIAITIGNGLYLNYIYKYKIGLDLHHFFRFIKKCWLVGIGVLLITYPINLIQLSNLYMQFTLHIFLFVVAYVFLLYTFVLTNKEKQSIILKFR